MKTNQEFQRLLNELAPRTEDQVVVAMVTIEIDDRNRPSLPNKKYSSMEKWERGYRSWRIHLEEKGKKQLLRAARRHLACGIYYHSIGHYLSFSSTCFTVTVDVLEPGVDFQVSKRLIYLDEHRNASYEVRVTALGASLPQGEWTIIQYESATLAEYVAQVDQISRVHSVYIYDEGLGEKNQPNQPDLLETVWGLGLTPRTD